MSQGEGGGRPTKYRPQFAAVAKRLCKAGATMSELAAELNVDERTVERWALLYPKFCRSVRIGRATADDRVERSLYQRAVGYAYEAERAVAVAGVGVEVARWRQVVEPDVGAAMNWLKNRRSKKWRDIKAQEVYTPPGKPLVVEHAPPGVDTLAEFYRREAAFTEQALRPGGEGLAGDDRGGSEGDGDAGAGAGGSVLPPDGDPES